MSEEYCESQPISVIVEVRDGVITANPIIGEEERVTGGELLRDVDWFWDVFHHDPQMMLFGYREIKDGKYKVVGILTRESASGARGVGRVYCDSFKIEEFKKLMTPEINATILGYRVTLFWAWYDMWLGAYWDRESKSLYLGILPTLMLRIRK